MSEEPKKTRVLILGDHPMGKSAYLHNKILEKIYKGEEVEIEYTSEMAKEQIEKMFLNMGRSFGRTETTAHEIVKALPKPAAKKLPMDNKPWYDQYVKRKRKKK